MPESTEDHEAIAHHQEQRAHRAGCEPVVIGASYSTPLVAIHALKQVDGKVHVLLINKNPSVCFPLYDELNHRHDLGCAAPPHRFTR